VGGGVTVVGVLVWLITSWRDTIGRWLIGH
jgi:hypothetical protein